MIIGNLVCLLEVAEIERSVEFYRGIGFTFIGWWDPVRQAESFVWTGDGPPTFAELRAGSLVLRLKRAASGMETGRGNMLIALEVGDADSLHRRVSAAGFQPEPVNDDKGEGWRVFVVADPDGQRWAFYHPLGEHHITPRAKK